MLEDYGTESYVANLQPPSERKVETTEEANES
jgi:hypothetical protein